MAGHAVNIQVSPALVVQLMMDMSVVDIDLDW